jgi:hypothetical protein
MGSDVADREWATPPDAGEPDETSEPGVLHLKWPGEMEDDG